MLQLRRYAGPGILALVGAALEMVDYVTVFGEKDPRKLLSIIKPDVHCNGEEYGKSCVEAGVVEKYGGKTHLIKLVKGCSSSKLIEKISKN